MLDASTIIVAWLSLLGSAFTIWFTMFRRGTVRMTQPAFILLGTDCEGTKPKIAVGAHLYTTAQRGAVVEGMFARATREDTTQDFEIWVYGKGKLSRGSGMHVGQEGVTGDHHFLLPEGSTEFRWLPGRYTVEIFGTIVGRPGIHRFWQLQVELETEIGEENDCAFFDWRPALHRYQARIFTREDRVERDAGRLRDLILSGIAGPAESD